MDLDLIKRLSDKFYYKHSELGEFAEDVILRTNIAMNLVIQMSDDIVRSRGLHPDSEEYEDVLERIDFMNDEFLKCHVLMIDTVNTFHDTWEELIRVREELHRELQ